MPFAYPGSKSQPLKGDSCSASWEKHRAVQANLTQNDIQNLPPTDPDLTCSLCNRLLRDAVKTPCCSTSYCEECIQNYLSENDFVCPECESKIKSLKNLIKDEDRRTRAKQYLDDMLKASRAQTEIEKAEADGDGENARSEEEYVNAEDGGVAEEGELAGDEQVCLNSHSIDSVLICHDPSSSTAIGLAGRLLRGVVGRHLQARKC